MLAILVSIEIKMKIKSEKGSITLLVLTSCLFFLVAVTTVGMHMQAKQIAVDREYKQIKESYEKDVPYIEEIYDKLKQERDLEILFEDITITPSIKQISVKATLNTDNIDIKTLKFGWYYNLEEPQNLSPENITQWTYVENTDGENKIVATTKYQENQRKGHYYLCFMVNNNTYWKEIGAPNMPEGWGLADKNNTDNDWYAYNDTSSSAQKTALVNPPKLADRNDTNNICRRCRNIKRNISNLDRRQQMGKCNNQRWKYVGMDTKICL